MLGMLARWGMALAMILGVQSLSGCDLPMEAGLDNISAEQQRVRANSFYVVSLNEDRAVVSAKGRQVAIEPAKGFCLAEDSVETSKLSAFALIGDCALDKTPDKSKRGARGELKLPRGVPGIITVSVSGNPQLEEAGGLKGMEAFLQTPAGRKLLGRGDDPSAVKIKETRQIGNGVYVLVEDDGAGVLPVLSKRFWRGFVQVNDRLAVVTVSGFRARPLKKDQMLEYLVDQVDTLTVANAAPLNEPQQILVAEAGVQDGGRVESGAVALGDLRPEPISIAVVKPASPTKAPQPNKRPATAGDDDAATSVATLTPATSSDEQKQAEEPAKPARQLAIAPQAVEPAARPSSASKTDSTRFAPAKAPAAPKRPRV